MSATDYARAMTLAALVIFFAWMIRDVWREDMQKEQTAEPHVWEEGRKKLRRNW